MDGGLRQILLQATLASALSSFGLLHTVWAGDLPDDEEDSKQAAAALEEDFYDGQLMRNDGTRANEKAGIVKIGDCRPCPPVPCPAPGQMAPSVPPAPDTPSTPDRPMAPSLTPDVPSGAFDNAFAPSAGPSIGMVAGAAPPSILGDFFSGRPTTPVNLQSTATVNNAFIEIFFIQNGNSTTTSPPAVNNPNNGSFATFSAVGGTGSAGGEFPARVNLFTIMPSADVPNPLPPSTLVGGIASGIPVGAFGYNYQFTGEAPLNVLVDSTQLQQVETALTVEGVNSGVIGGVNTSSRGYVTVPQAPGQPGGIVFYDSGPDQTRAFLFTTWTPVVKIQLPNAATAGSIKLSDNSSPIPRDRIIFDYSFFKNAALAPGGIDVNRFVAGFEKTVLTDWISVELRVPFATTLDQNILIDVENSGSIGRTNTDAVEFGNMAFWTKVLLFNNETWAASAGLGLGVPTANDIQLTRSDGVELYAIQNRAYHLLPFVGGVWMPNDKFFLQGMMQVDVDLSGNPTVINQDPNKLFSRGGTFTDAGKLNDPVFLFCDVSAGYWLTREQPGSGRFLTGLAAQFEVHYNQSLGGFDSVSAPMVDSTGRQLHFWNPDTQSIQPLALQIGGADAFTAVNLTTGFTAEILDNSQLSVGCAVPVVGGSGHEFDYEVRINFNHFFGRSTRAAGEGSRRTPSTL